MRHTLEKIAVNQDVLAGLADLGLSKNHWKPPKSNGFS
jgi:hypothetical protein